MSLWISTDLDGTLIDHYDYSYGKALAAIELCKQSNIPILFNTSKTFAEAEKLYSELQLNTPLIVENGSAIVLPATMLCVDNAYDSSILINDRYHIRFGVTRDQIIKFLSMIRTQYGYSFVGFNDWGANDVSDNTGLSLVDAELALMKEYSEPFLWHDSEDNFTHFESLAFDFGFQILKGGRFFHLLGKTNKAKPLQWIQSNINVLFPNDQQSCLKHTLICLGDSHNDVAMLNIADIPVLVRSPISAFPQLNTSNDVLYTQAQGPEGWAEAITAILSNDLRTEYNG